jgi:hypothetical protein
MKLQKYEYLGKSKYADEITESSAINRMISDKIESISDDDLMLTIQEALRCPSFKDNIKRLITLLVREKTFQIDDMAILEELWQITWRKNDYAQKYLLEMIDDDEGNEYWKHIDNIEIYGTGYDDDPHDAIDSGARL